MILKTVPRTFPVGYPVQECDFVNLVNSMIRYGDTSVKLFEATSRIRSCIPWIPRDALNPSQFIWIDLAPLSANVFLQNSSPCWMLGRRAGRWKGPIDEKHARRVMPSSGLFIAKRVVVFTITSLQPFSMQSSEEVILRSTRVARESELRRRKISQMSRWHIASRGWIHSNTKKKKRDDTRMHVRAFTLSYVMTRDNLSNGNIVPCPNAVRSYTRV